MVVCRYINHSCAPNCVAEVVTFERGHKIIISSNRRIQKGEEVSVWSFAVCGSLGVVSASFSERAHGFPVLCSRPSLLRVGPLSPLSDVPHSSTEYLLPPLLGPSFVPPSFTWHHFLCLGLLLPLLWSQCGRIPLTIKSRRANRHRCLLWPQDHGLA